jgi:hypothetical protein
MLPELRAEHTVDNGTERLKADTVCDGPRSQVIVPVMFKGNSIALF